MYTIYEGYDQFTHGMMNTLSGTRCQYGKVKDYSLVITDEMLIAWHKSNPVVNGDSHLQKRITRLPRWQWVCSQ